MQSTLAEFQETQSEQPFALQNSKLLKVSLNQVTIQAKAGRWSPTRAKSRSSTPGAAA